jgi:hypothetical protein
VNYAELQQAIIDYTENAEATFVASIPTFVRLAEKRIYDAGYLPAARESQVGTLTIGSPYLAAPTDMISPFALSVTSGTGLIRYLIEKDVTYIREAYPDPAAEAMPKYYGQFDENTLIVGPTPDLAYSVQLDFFAYPESIATAGTTWLGDKADQVLLYGSLREAYNVFMKGEQDMVATINTMYTESITLMQERGIFAKRAQPYRRTR